MPKGISAKNYEEIQIVDIYTLKNICTVPITFEECEQIRTEFKLPMREFLIMLGYPPESHGNYYHSKRYQPKNKLPFKRTRELASKIINHFDGDPPTKKGDIQLLAYIIFQDSNYEVRYAHTRNHYWKTHAHLPLGKAGVWVKKGIMGELEYIGRMKLAKVSESLIKEKLLELYFQRRKNHK